MLPLALEVARDAAKLRVPFGSHTHTHTSRGPAPSRTLKRGRTNGPEVWRYASPRPRLATGRLALAASAARAPRPCCLALAASPWPARLRLTHASPLPPRPHRLARASPRQLLAPPAPLRLNRLALAASPAPRLATASPPRRRHCVSPLAPRRYRLARASPAPPPRRLARAASQTSEAEHQCARGAQLVMRRSRIWRSGGIGPAGGADPPGTRSHQEALVAPMRLPSRQSRARPGTGPRLSAPRHAMPVSPMSLQLHVLGGRVGPCLGQARPHAANMWPPLATIN